MQREFTISQVAKRLGVTEQTVYNYIRGFFGNNRYEGRSFYRCFVIPTSVNSLGKTVVTESALTRFIKECDKKSMFGNYLEQREARDSKCFTISKAASELGVSVRTLYRLIRTKRVQAISLPSKALRITPSQIKWYKDHL